MTKFLTVLSLMAITCTSFASENIAQVLKPDSFAKPRELIWERDNGKQFVYQDNNQGSRTLYPETDTHVIDQTNIVTASSPKAVASAVHGSFHLMGYLNFLGDKSVPILWARARSETCQSPSDAQIVLSFTEPLKSVGAYVSILSGVDYSSGSAAFGAKMWYRLKNSSTWNAIQGSSSAQIGTDGFHAYRDDAPFLGVKGTSATSSIEEVRFCANYIDSTVDRHSHEVAISRLYFEK
jgi:hypothetical protein